MAVSLVIGASAAPVQAALPNPSSSKGFPQPRVKGVGKIHETTLACNLWGQRLVRVEKKSQIHLARGESRLGLWHTRVPVCGVLQGDLPAQILQRGLNATSVEELVEIGEDTLFAAGRELEEDFPALSFPAQLLEASSDGLKSFRNLPGEERIKILVVLAGLWLYVTARPGVLAGAVDSYVLAPLQTVLNFARGRKAYKRTDFVLGRRLGEGSFGTVFEGALRLDGSMEEEEIGRRSKKLEDISNTQKLSKVVLKKVKIGVYGAEQSGEVEEWFNLRMQRVAPEACAIYLGSFVADKTRGQFVEGGKWLVWKFEGDSTLGDFMADRNFPDNIGDALFGASFLKGADKARRRAVIIRQLLRQVLLSLRKMHGTGIVHRDIKPSNMMVTNRGDIKLIDFGAATDLRVGKNYIPDMGMLDPDYCPPEQYVLPENTPIPPPEPVAAILSPILWQLNHPDLFDMYSLGVVFLQMACPQVRTAVGMQMFKAELKDAGYDLKEWRRITRTKPNLELLDIDGGRGWDLATKLVSTRGQFFKGRLSAAEALRHPYFLLSGDQAAVALAKLSLTR